MTRDPRYDCLFEPLRIGPVTAKNRFYQVPHCTGMGYVLPETLAAMRRAKAEGGWGVVCTEYASIHPTSDDSPFPSCTLWDEGDVRTMATIAEAIHEHGALAGTQLWHGGLYAANKGTRELPLSPSGGPIAYLNPLHARAMDKQDIKELRRWQVEAARRAERAGFDIIYVYAGHAYLPFQFITPRFNQRSDEYGGSLENRVRLFREMIEETKEAVGARCAVAVRFAVHEFQVEGGLTSDGEGREVVEMLAELPDLWDVNISDYRNDSGSSRFFPEGSQEAFTGFVKSLTTKPVVGVGRYTSPDAMAAALRRGTLDLIGAARPSIADPFLPKKIEEGRHDEIRECIGCNICRATFKGCVPIRCTQNPTMGEEFRRGWHPENIRPKGSDRPVLVVGAGPAGLECAMALGARGYDVTLAEATRETGGHIAQAARLPGLAAWGRVRDYRLGRIGTMPNVQLYLESRLGAMDILEYGFARVVLATGSRWRPDGVGRSNPSPVEGCEVGNTLTPEEVLAGAPVAGPVVIFDDEHYYMGGALAEMLRRNGHEVSLVTPAPEPSIWTQWTDEHHLLVPHLHELGIGLVVSHNLVRFDGTAVHLAFVHTGEPKSLACATLVLTTSRTPNRELYDALASDPKGLEAAGIVSLTRVGDCLAPGLTADAVYAGHRYAEELDAPEGAPGPLRERIVSGETRTTRAAETMGW
ncbi:MAG: FAD-dependent oxidoreductase [Kiloniellales bacterium]